MGDIRKSKNDSHHHSTIGVVFLAGGLASRIGYRPKCLLELEGKSLIQRQLQMILDLPAWQIIVVLGHYADLVEPVVRTFPIAVVHNPHPSAGQNSSLHCGLRALPQQLDAVLVVLADQPLLNKEDICELIYAFHQRPKMTDVVVPTVNDLPGNPVIFSVDVKDEILAHDASFGCKQWQLANPERVHRWQTVNQHYLIDIDTLEDIDAFAKHTGLQLRWPSHPSD
jgi:molybdenum cofactor cytidylyltransferase